MTTPLGLARQLQLSFPEFVEVRIVRDGAYRLRAYCVITNLTVSAENLAKWSSSHIMAGSVIAFEQVTRMPPAADAEESLLRQTSVPRIVAETADTSGPGLVKILRSLFPDEVIDVVGSHGHITVHLDPSVPASRDQALVDATRLLMGFDVLSLTTTRQPSTSRRAAHLLQKESAATYQQLREDQARLCNLLPEVLTAASLELPNLPDGVSTYASPHDGVDSLLQRLALFDRVYVYMPFCTDDFPTWAGASLHEFLDVLPTGRVIPVFGQHLDRYEPGLTTRVLEAGAPRVVLQGEHALRMARGLRDDHPALSVISSEAGAEIRKALAGSSDSDALRLLRYFDAVAQMASRLPTVAVNGDSLATTTFPFAEWLDGIRVDLAIHHVRSSCAALQNTARSLDPSRVSR